MDRANMWRTFRLAGSILTHTKHINKYSTVSRGLKPRLSSAVSPPKYQYPAWSNATCRRWNSSLTVPASEASEPTAPERQPSYQLTFTCKPCGHRSAHLISKQGYHHGTVLISCPSCKNRHVISDHLKIFMDEKSTLEDILKRTAQDGDLSKLLKKGRLGMRDGHLVANEGEEDIEFWEDGTETKHDSPRSEKEG